jgi:hypothetical protein
MKSKLDMSAIALTTTASQPTNSPRGAGVDDRNNRSISRLLIVAM